MEELKIERLIGQNNTTITLTENELERAYRIKERRYLEEALQTHLPTLPRTRIPGSIQGILRNFLSW